MGILKLLIGKKPDSQDDKKNSGEAVATAVAIESTVKDSVAKTATKFQKAPYNPQTRRAIYDDGNAHKEAIDRAFANGNTPRDPYTGAELYKKQRDAKAAFGKNWQSNAAEADHIDPLKQIVDRMSDNAWVTEEDIKNIANDQSNFQVMSRKLNQNSKSAGKGGRTQEEWAGNADLMRGVSEEIQSGESIEVVRDRIIKTGKDAQRRNDFKAFKKGAKNIAKTSVDAGVEGAVNAGTMALTMSGITNIVSVLKGEKTGEEAVEDTIRDGGKAAVTGFAMNGSLTPVIHSLSYSSDFVKALVQSNVPSTIITAVAVTGETLKKWGEGEITTQECIIQLGDKGLNITTVGYWMAAGQTIIQIPFVGAAVGALVGSALTSNMYNNLINDLQTKQLEHEERMRIIEECKIYAEQARLYRQELEEYLEEYFKEYSTCFDRALSNMKIAYEMGDADTIIANANRITSKLGGQVKFETVEEWKRFMDDDSVDVI